MKQSRMRLWLTSEQPDKFGLQSVHASCDALSLDRRISEPWRLSRHRYSGGFQVLPNEPVVSSLEMHRLMVQLLSQMGSDAGKLEGSLALELSDDVLTDLARIGHQDQVLNAFTPEIPFFQISREMSL